MSSRRERVRKAFAHEEPDRTPLFEIFQPFHPIHWDIAGRTIATDEAAAWDAMADGVSQEEMNEASARAQFAVCRYFELDMVRLNGAPKVEPRPVKTGRQAWTRNGVAYALHPRTKLVVPDNPNAALADSLKSDPATVRAEIESWDGAAPPRTAGLGPVERRFRELAAAQGIDWVYMAEMGAGTGVAFWPPFFLMWLIEEPDLVRRWLERSKAFCFAATAASVDAGCEVVALGGDVSCDKGPFISPAHYREFILPVIREHTALVHAHGGLAVYTSDGNHWAIADMMFRASNVDGYKEVDHAAGMTMERLIESGYDREICIIGNLDARHTLCHAEPAAAQAFVRRCLDLGRRSPGGHILHASHSVHEDVKSENYHAAVAAYRDYFGLDPLPR